MRPIWVPVRPDIVPVYLEKMRKLLAIGAALLLISMKGKSELFRAENGQLLPHICWVNKMVNYRASPGQWEYQ